MTDHERRGLAIRVLQEMHYGAIGERNSLELVGDDESIRLVSEEVDALDYALTILKGDDDDQRAGD